MLGTAVLLGWCVQMPAVTSFIHSPLRMQPLTAVAHILLALAIVACICGRSRLGAMLVAAPLIIGSATIAQDVLAIDLGLDRLIFADHVVHQCRIFPGRPGPVPAITILLLVLAVIFSLLPDRRTARAALLLSSLTVGISIISAAALPLDAGIPQRHGFNIFMSVPSGLAAILNATALILWLPRRAWPGLLRTGVDRGTFRMIFVICALAPVSFALIVLWSTHNARLDTETLEILRAIAQSMVSVAILFWVWSRIAEAGATQVKLTRALDSAPIAIARPDGTIIHWSQGCERLYQFTADEAIGRNKHALLHSSGFDDRETAVQSVGQIVEAEREIVEKRRDGATLNVLEQVRLVQDDPRSEPVIVMSMVDITARKRAEEALRASDMRLALAVDAHEIGIFDWDRDIGKVILSPDAERLLGIPAGSPPESLTDLQNKVEARFTLTFFPEAQAVLERQLPRTSLLLRAADPDERPYLIEGSARCFYGPDGALSRLTGVLFDSTEHERRAAELEVREGELRAILETVPEALVTIDIHGTVRSFSAKAEELFGHDAAAVVGRNAAMLLPVRLRAEYDRSLRHYLATGDYGYAGPGQGWSGLRADGSEFPIDFSAGEADVGANRIITLFVRDLSEEIANQARLSELREDLLHVSRLSAMGEMAAGLAHELNQPLAALSNFLGAAELAIRDDSVDKDRIYELVGLAAKQALRAGEIIRRVRTFVSRGEVEFGAQRVDDVIADAIELALTSTERKHVDIRWTVDPDHDRILADRVQIQQVLVNMIRNAVEAMTEASTALPRICFEARPIADRMMEISVRDNGPGFPAEVLERHHEHFVSTKAHGMGIGLSICRRIVEAHRGQLHTENRAEGGALLRFTVPEFHEMDVAR